MLGNFRYHNPTKLYFGDEALGYLNEELPKFGKTVQLIYGGGSIKKNGVYDQVKKAADILSNTISNMNDSMSKDGVKKQLDNIEVTLDILKDWIRP